MQAHSPLNCINNERSNKSILVKKKGDLGRGTDDSQWTYSLLSEGGQLRIVDPNQIALRSPYEMYITCRLCDRNRVSELIWNVDWIETMVGDK